MIETEDKIIELDWYKDYGIKVIPSVKSGEAYCLGNFKIDKDYGAFKQLQDNYKVMYHKTFAFFLKSQIDRAYLIRCFINIEKLYLLHKLGGKSLRYIEKLIKPEGANGITLTKELVEDIADLNLDAELEKETEGKEIYFFERLSWRFNERKPFFADDVIISVRARFNFLILDK